VADPLKQYNARDSRQHDYYHHCAVVAAAHGTPVMQ